MRFTPGTVVLCSLSKGAWRNLHLLITGTEDALNPHRLRREGSISCLLERPTGVHLCAGESIGCQSP